MRPAPGIRYLTPRLWVSERGTATTPRLGQPKRSGRVLVPASKGPPFFHLLPSNGSISGRGPRSWAQAVAGNLFTSGSPRGSGGRFARPPRHRPRWGRSQPARRSSTRNCTSVSARCDCSDKSPEGNGPRQQETMKRPGFWPIWRGKVPRQHAQAAHSFQAARAAD